MNRMSKKLVAAAAIAALATMGAAAPVNAAGSAPQARTVWCC